MQSAPRICVAIGRETIDDALAAADSVSSLADVLEIRLDCLNVPAVSPFMNSLTRPLLFTNRPLWEGGKYEGSEEERLGPLLEAVTENCSYVDLELLAPESSHSQLQNVLKDSDSHLILSHHNFQETPDHGELVGRLAQMREMGADIGKIITMAHSPGDVLRVLQLQELAADLKFPLIAFCMGRPGVISRVATCDLGGYMTYCAPDDGEATAPGQLSVSRLRDIYSLMGGA